MSRICRNLLIAASVLLLAQSTGVAGFSATLGARTALPEVRFLAGTGDEIVITVEGRRLRVVPGSLTVPGASGNQIEEVLIDVPACSVQEVKDEVLHQSGSDNKDPWATLVRKISAIFNADLFAKEILVPGSVKNQAMPTALPVDATTGSGPPDSSSATAGGQSGHGAGLVGSIPVAPQVFQILDSKFAKVLGMTHTAEELKRDFAITYKLKCRRIDTIAADPAGKVQLLTGTQSPFSPEAPAVQPGWIKLANVYAEPENKSLQEKDVLPIEVNETPALPQQMREQNQRLLANTLGKLKEGRPVKIAFWGDSVTCGGFASTQSAGFPNLLIGGLQKTYPGSDITAVVAGLSGSSSGMRIGNFKKEVLSKQPDLVIIEFVNDLLVEPASTKANIGTAIDQARAAGCEVILCTPNLVAPSYMKLKNWQAVVDSAHMNVIRDLGKEKNVVVVDVARRYAGISREGLVPELLLADRLVHPNDRGHEIYAEELLMALR